MKPSSEFERLGDSDDLQNALERLWEAQQRWIKDHPGEYEAYQAREKAKLAAEAEHNELREYVLRGVPRGIASTLQKGSDQSGVKLYKPAFYGQMYRALQGGKVIVVLAGVLGAGKTIAACKWMMRQSDGLYVKARHYCAFSEKYSEDREQIEVYRRTMNLVLDEMSMEAEQDTQKLGELVHDRYENARVTIMCVNKSPKEAESMLGERISSRIWEAGEIIPCTDILRRGEKIRQQRSKR